jgi:hypothetical protein
MDLVSRVAHRYVTLKTADGILSVGETFENELWRVHRYREAIRVTHLENAGRRGKQCVEFLIHSNIPGKLNPWESLAMEFMMHAKRKDSLPRMNQVAEEAKETGFDVDKQIRRGVDVSPGGFQKLLIRGAHVTIEADYDRYSIEDITDDDNQPTCIARGKKSIKQFYRWVKDNAKTLQTMTMHQIMEAMGKEGIEYHYYCARD